MWRVCPYFFLFSSSSPIFEGFAFVILGLSSCLPCLFLCPCGVCVFFFPFGLYAKRKGAPCWCVLACPVVGCFIWLLLYTPRTLQMSARLYRNKVLEKGNLTECSKLFCARLCSYLCSSKSFSYLFLLVGFCFLSPFQIYLISSA